MNIAFRFEAYINYRRSEETKKYAYIFIRFFNERVGEWIRSKDIYLNLVNPDNIQHTSQVTRLLSDLTTLGILERREDPRVKGTRGSPPVYYRVQELVTDTESIGEVNNYVEELEIKILYLEQQLEKAKQIIKDHAWLF